LLRAARRQLQDQAHPVGQVQVGRITLAARWQRVGGRLRVGPGFAAVVVELPVEHRQQGDRAVGRGRAQGRVAAAGCCHAPAGPVGRALPGACEFISLAQRPGLPARPAQAFGTVQQGPGHDADAAALQARFHGVAARQPQHLAVELDGGDLARIDQGVQVGVPLPEGRLQAAQLVGVAARDGLRAPHGVDRAPGQHGQDGQDDQGHQQFDQREAARGFHVSSAPARWTR
jgi:hypothetical protein